MFLEKSSGGGEKCALCEAMWGLGGSGGAALNHRALLPPGLAASQPPDPLASPSSYTPFLPSLNLLTAYIVKGYYQPAGPLISHHLHHHGASTSSGSGSKSSPPPTPLETGPAPSSSRPESESEPPLHPPPPHYRSPFPHPPYSPYPTYQYLQPGAYHQDCYPSPHAYYHSKYPPAAYRRYSYYPTQEYSPAPGPPPSASSQSSQSSSQLVTSPADPFPPPPTQGPPPTLVDPYPPHPPPPHPSYYPYAGPPAPPTCYSHSPPTRGLPFMEPAFQACPYTMQPCPKNVHTGPLTGASKGSKQQAQPLAAAQQPIPLVQQKQNAEQSKPSAQNQQGQQQQQVVQQRPPAPAPLPPVALALPLEPTGATLGPPSPARGSAGMPRAPSPAISTARSAQWSPPGLLTVATQPPQEEANEHPSPPLLDMEPRKRRKTISRSPSPQIPPPELTVVEDRLSSVLKDEPEAKVPPTLPPAVPIRPTKRVAKQMPSLETEVQVPEPKRRRSSSGPNNNIPRSKTPPPVKEPPVLKPTAPPALSVEPVNKKPTLKASKNQKEKTTPNQKSAESIEKPKVAQVKESEAQDKKKGGKKQNKATAVVKPTNGIRVKKEPPAKPSKGAKIEISKGVSGKKKVEKEGKELILCPKKTHPTLKWSNGWSWEGEPYKAKVFLTSDGNPEMRICYPAMRHIGGDVIYPRDSILLRSGTVKKLPYVAKVAAMWEDPDDGEMMVSLLWYYRPEHTDLKITPDQPLDEVFASRHKDTNSVACIEDKCYVLTFLEYCRYRKYIKGLELGLNTQVSPVVPSQDCPYPRAKRVPQGQVSSDIVFFCRKVYDFRTRRIIKSQNNNK